MTKQDEIVERVAKAIAGSFYDDESAWAGCVDEAEAAITAMQAAGQERVDDDDAEWLLDKAHHLPLVDRARLKSIANRLQPKAPETGEG